MHFGSPPNSSFHAECHLGAYVDLCLMVLRLLFTGRKRPSVTDAEPSLGEGASTSNGRRSRPFLV